MGPCTERENWELCPDTEWLFMSLCEDFSEEQINHHKHKFTTEASS